MKGDKLNLDYDAIHEDMYSRERYSFTFTSLVDFSINPLSKKVRLLTKAGAYTDGKKFVTVLLTKAKYENILHSKSFYNCTVNSETHPEFFDESNPLMKQRLVDFIIERARLWVEVLETEDWAVQADESSSEDSDDGIFTESESEGLPADDVFSEFESETAPAPASFPSVRRRSARIAGRWRRRSIRIAGKRKN